MITKREDIAEYKGYDVNYVSTSRMWMTRSRVKAIEEGVSREEIERFIKECKRIWRITNVKPR